VAKKYFLFPDYIVTYSKELTLYFKILLGATQVAKYWHIAFDIESITIVGEVDKKAAKMKTVITICSVVFVLAETGFLVFYLTKITSCFGIWKNYEECDLTEVKKDDGPPCLNLI
jgi:hypothetical protein